MVHRLAVTKPDIQLNLNTAGSDLMGVLTITHLQRICVGHPPTPPPRSTLSSVGRRVKN